MLFVTMCLCLQPEVHAVICSLCSMTQVGMYDINSNQRSAAIVSAKL